MHEFASSSYAPLPVVVILVAVTWFLIAHEACWCLKFFFFGWDCEGLRVNDDGGMSDAMKGE